MTTPAPTDSTDDRPRYARYTDIAPHIRADVRADRVRSTSGRTHYWITVYNTATDAELCRTDAFEHNQAMTTAAEIVTAARATWFWGLDRHDAAPGRPKTLTIDAGDAQAVMTVLVGGKPYRIERLVSRLTALLGP